MNRLMPQFMRGMPPRQMNQQAMGGKMPMSQHKPMYGGGSMMGQAPKPIYPNDRFAGTPYAGTGGFKGPSGGPLGVQGGDYQQQYRDWMQQQPGMTNVYYQPGTPEFLQHQQRQNERYNAWMAQRPQDPNPKPKPVWGSSGGMPIGMNGGIRAPQEPLGGYQSKSNPAGVPMFPGGFGDLRRY